MLKQAGVVCVIKTAKIASQLYIPYSSLHSRDTVLAVLLWVNIMHYSSTFFYAGWKFLVY